LDWQEGTGPNGKSKHIIVALDTTSLTRNIRAERLPYGLDLPENYLDRTVYCIDASDIRLASINIPEFSIRSAQIKWSFNPALQLFTAEIP
jgi:hypothetical protein